MPATSVLFYAEDGISPVLEDLEHLRRKNEAAAAACYDRIESLVALGHELRRPLADALRDGIRELRARHLNTHYRVLYFFHGKGVAVLAHLVSHKKGAVDPADIDRALRRKARFEADPASHTLGG